MGLVMDKRHSCHSGNSKGFRSSVTETGTETKYVFLTISHNTTDALMSLSFTASLSPGQYSYRTGVGQGKALAPPTTPNATHPGSLPG